MTVHLRDGIRNSLTLVSGLAVTCLLHTAGAHAAVNPAGQDLTNLSLERLMEIEVTSVSKRAQSLNDAPAAIHVLSGDDIRNSGARSIPEALRGVPGLSVANINGHTWAISSRGFNGRFANKLLVLIDGRTVYTPLFSGVFWDRQYPAIENIERIEIIRGPGGALWGANAVNGVINIITKSPADQTPGSTVSVATGTEMRQRTLARHVGAVSDDATYRVTGLTTDRRARTSGVSDDGGDDWAYQFVEARSDWTPRIGDSIEFLGSAYHGVAAETFPSPTLTAPYSVNSHEDTETEGANVLARLNRRIDEDESVTFQAFYDYNAFSDVRLNSSFHTLDAEGQHEFTAGDRHRFVWGTGFRSYWYGLSSSQDIAFTRTQGNEYVANGFVQDTISLVPDTLYLTLGSKVEYHSDTHINVQPSARALLHVAPEHSLWASVSRAVRTPSLGERFVLINRRVLPPLSAGNPSALPARITIVGTDDVQAETLTAYEAGYRGQVTESAAVDVTAFVNNYRNLVNVETGSSTLSMVGGAHLETDLNLKNDMRGTTYGTEVAGTVNVQPDWQLRGSYSYLRINLELPNQVNNTSSLSQEDESPRHQASLMSTHLLDESTRLDWGLRYVSRLFALGVDSYLVADFQLSHEVADGLEVALIGRNLAPQDHFEYGPESSLATEPTRVPRTLMVELTARF